MIRLPTTPPIAVPDPAAAMRIALDAQRGGNPRLAHLVALALAEACPDYAPPLRLAAALAARAGYWAPVTRWCERYEQAGGAPHPDIAVLRAEAARRPPPAARGQRHVVIKAWGFGFWSDVLHVLEGLLFAELTGRTPIVHWGARSLYGDGGRSDAFARFFAPIGTAPLAALAVHDPADRAPASWLGCDLFADAPDAQTRSARDNWPLALLGSEAGIVVHDVNNGLRWLLAHLPPGHRLAGATTLAAARDLARRWLRPSPAIVAEADRFLAAHGLDRRPFIAVHVRGLDKRHEEANLADHQVRLARLARACLAAAPDLALLLLTDDARIAPAYADLGTRLVITDAVKGTGDAGLHHAADRDGERLGRAALRDVLMGARADGVFGGAFSNMSWAMAFMGDVPAERVAMVGDDHYLADFDLTSCLR